jgi:AcrR family transcriptional regulator
MADRRQEILDAAVDLADERGLDAVSMRAIAERTGVTPMALYPHVGSKAELLDGMVERLVANVTPAAPTPDQDWRERLRVIARALRGLAHRHPWAAALLFSRPAVTPDAVRGVDLVYMTLLDAGVPDSEVPRMERLVTTLVIGYAASEAGGRFGPGDLDPRARRDLLRGQPLPGHRRIVRWLEAPVDWDAEFEADVDDLLRLIEMAAEPAPTRAGRAGSPR